MIQFIHQINKCLLDRLLFCTEFVLKKVLNFQSIDLKKILKCNEKLLNLINPEPHRPCGRLISDISVTSGESVWE